MSDDYLNIKNYAKRQKVSRQTVYDWINANKLEKNKDYILVSGKPVIKLNEKTKNLFASR